MSKTMQAKVASDPLFDAHIAECIDPTDIFIFYHQVGERLHVSQQIEDVLRISLTPRREILVPIEA